MRRLIISSLGIICELLIIIILAVSLIVGFANGGILGAIGHFALAFVACVFAFGIVLLLVEIAADSRRTYELMRDMCHGKGGHHGIGCCHGDKDVVGACCPTHRQQAAVCADDVCAPDPVVCCPSDMKPAEKPAEKGMHAAAAPKAAVKKPAPKAKAAAKPAVKPATKKPAAKKPAKKKT